MRWLTINWFLKIACATAGEAQKWLEAFDQAKQQVRQVSYQNSMSNIEKKKYKI